MDASKKATFWAGIENYLVRYGRRAWLWMLLAAIVYVLIAFISIGMIQIYQGSGIYASLVTELTANIVWDFIFFGVTMVFWFTWIKPKFSKKCEMKQWQELVDDVFVFGKIRIPKMLLIGIILQICCFGGYGWGGLLILGPAVLILLFAPVTITWKTGASASKPANVEAAVEPAKPVETKATPVPLAKPVEKKVTPVPAAKPVEKKATPAPVVKVEEKVATKPEVTSTTIKTPDAAKVEEEAATPKPAKKAATKPAKKTTKKAVKKPAA